MVAYSLRGHPRWSNRSGRFYRRRNLRSFFRRYIDSVHPQYRHSLALNLRGIAIEILGDLCRIEAQGIGSQLVDVSIDSFDEIVRVLFQIENELPLPILSLD